jgi:hypothetical protein
MLFGSSKSASCSAPTTGKMVVDLKRRRGRGKTRERFWVLSFLFCFLLFFNPKELEKGFNL